VTTAYSVDVDITFEEINSRTKRYDPSSRPTLDTDVSVEIEQHGQEIRHLRAFGDTDVQIMTKLKLTEKQYSAALKSMGLPEYLSPEDRFVMTILDRCIESGVPFSSDSLPMGSTARFAPEVINRARTDGRIKKIGTVSTPTGRVNVWLNVNAEIPVDSDVTK
jgi:hypothetical protein